MKRNLIRLFVLLLAPSTLLAGGIVTNTNQSASFIRNPAQDAVIDASGAYFNPAGLAFLNDGLHFSISNQTINQTRTIKSTFPGMKRSEFEGIVNAPVFPTIYGVYKMDKLAFSFGVNPIGGGGSASFENGLPSFEQRVAVLPAMLTAAGISTTEYSMDAAFDGTSLNWGFQANTSYAINDMFSVAAGLRYVVAKNTYTGHLKAISINPMHPANADGLGNKTSASGFFQTIGMADLAIATADKQLEATQSGSGIVPIVGVNVKFSENLNFAIKYEHKASITLTNNTTVDDVGMYPNNAEVSADMPAMIASGISYKVLPALMISTGVHYYFDKNADFGKSLPNSEIIDKNFMEAALGLEYSITPAIMVSAGFLRTQSGVNEKFQSDLGHNLSTNSISIGGKFNFNENIGVNLGIMNTMYEDFTRQFTGYNETYSRKALTIGLGLDLRF
jgi:long-chain fatty acid transport protein